MNKINRKRGKGVLLLAGLVVFLISCEKEVLLKGSGQKVAVNFSVVSGGYDANEEAVRSFDTEESETEVVHLEKDLYLYAKLVADEDEVRAVTTSALIEGQRVHLEAYYTSSGSIAGSADYHANSQGKLVLDDPDQPLEVDPALGPYDFAAYSYYQSTGALSATNINPTASDLVWGNALNQAISATEAGRTVEITMKHKFSKVRVKIDVNGVEDAEITDIGTVQIVGGKTVNLTVKDGSLALVAPDVAKTVDAWTGISSPFSEKVIVSDYSLFYPSPTSVSISSITLTVEEDVHVFSDLSAVFTKALTAGKHYTLVVDLKKILWAQSNIYWEETLNDGDGGLTFQKSGDTPNHSDYQGVYFRWGSLIGISPAGGKTAEAVGDVVIYIPPVKAGEHWDGTKKVSSSHTLWTGAGSWANIPYLSASVVQLNYLYDHPAFSTYKGDVCSFLTGGVWRMPNKDEILLAVGTVAWSIVTAADPNNASGKGPGGVGIRDLSGFVFFPVTGERYSDRGGTLTEANIGAAGFYWSGTSSAYWAFRMSFRDSKIYPQEVNDIGHGHSIRCIKVPSTE
jgi:hypothetical protein